jgi:solute:Na+ symporter, SSS family
MVRIDWIILILYFVIVSLYGYWIYKRKKQKEASSADFFIAEGSLTWWAIGASLIASNISAEQMTGMSGSGFQLGLAISSYEWMAALTLIIVAVFFMPVYLKNKIFTMPQFLNQRYNSKVAMAMAVFWLLLYIVVNLLSILYLGAVAIAGISGLDFSVCVFLLAIFSVFIALGGMKVVGYTSAIQVFFLVVSGFIVLFIALKMIGGSDGIFAGFRTLRSEAADHFHMIFKKDNPNYIDLPGMSVLLGGMWIANLNYWGCNQYITQRALGASLPVARKGILFAAFLKMLMPFIIVLPGIAIYYLYSNNMLDVSLINTTNAAGELKAESNRTYSALLTLLPDGIKGVTIAAFAATVVSSLAAKVNSISTIFTLDIYKKAFNKNASEAVLVKIGKIAIIISTVIGIILTLGLGDTLMGEGKQGFQYIQEYTGFVSPGIFAMFLLGFFWKKTTSNAALFATIGGFIFSVVLKFLPGMIDLEPLYSVGLAVEKAGVFEIPFLDRMAIVFVLCVIGMYFISIIENRKGVKPNSLEIDASMFKTSAGFAVGSLIIIGLLVALYTMFW